MARAPAQPAARPARRKTATSGTRKTAAPATPAAEPAPPPKRRLALPSLDTGATLLRNIILNVVFVLAAALFIAVMIGQFLYDQVVIEPIAVPKALIEQGITPEVAASRLWDGLRDAQTQARTSKASVSAIPDSQRIQFALPDVGLSLDSIVRQTRQFFNLHQTRVGGEIVCKTEACTPGEMQLRLRVLKGTNEVIDLPPMEGVDQRGYFTNAAVQVLSVLDPFVAVAAIADAQPVRATALARRLVRQRHTDAKWAHNLIGNVHTNAADYNRAISEYRAALALDPESTWPGRCGRPVNSMPRKVHMTRYRRPIRTILRWSKARQSCAMCVAMWMVQSPFCSRQPHSIRPARTTLPGWARSKRLGARATKHWSGSSGRWKSTPPMLLRSNRSSSPMPVAATWPVPRR